MKLTIGCDSYDKNVLMIFDTDAGEPFAFTRSKDNAEKISAIPTMLEALEAVYHQLATDSDLETVTGAAKYADLTRMVALAIAEADPGNPQIRNNHDVFFALRERKQS